MMMDGLNQVQTAWEKAIRDKLGTHTVVVRCAEDIPMLARVATGTTGGDTHEREGGDEA